jgi:hypothetical protein
VEKRDRSLKSPPLSLIARVRTAVAAAAAAAAEQEKGKRRWVLCDTMHRAETASSSSTHSPMHTFYR